MALTDTIDQRRKFVNAWNSTMVDIWRERIKLLSPPVYDTGSLYSSIKFLRIDDADERWTRFTLSQTFLEYGLWQDLGVGREVPHGNPGDIGHDKVRERRRWFSVKYFSSTLRMRDFMAESLGDEFKAMFCSALDVENARYDTEFYRRKGYTR